MRITIAAIGKMRAGAEAALLEDYLRRLPWKITIKECEIKSAATPTIRKEKEAEALREACAQADRLIALDERGKELSSREFSQQLKAWQLAGDSHIGFIIGGADGLDAALVKRCHLTLAFGRMSWPHMLARAMLAEQLYRAHTLLSGHPYHRD